METPLHGFLVDFTPCIGWRVRSRTEYHPSIAVIETPAGKRMRIPSLDLLKAGRFCNPRTVVMRHFHHLQFLKRGST